MKKRYIFILLSIITTIAYIDMADSCRRIDKAISQTLEINDDYKTRLIVKKNPYFKILDPNSY